MTSSILVWKLDLPFSKCGPLGIPKTLSGRPQSQNNFHNKMKTTVLFHCVDVAVIMQMQPLVPQHKPRWWLHTIPVATVSPLTSKGGKKSQFTEKRF